MEDLQVLIETPRNCRTKYTLNPQTGRFLVKKVLPEGMVFPYDFGCIPGSKGQDGDPLDVLVMAEFPLFQGCEVLCRLLGAIQAEQSDKDAMIRNDRYIAVPVQSLIYQSITSIEQLNQQSLDEVEKFFVHYNELEDKKFRPVKRLNASEAQQLMKQSQQA